MLEKILSDAAISKASPMVDNNIEVYRDLAAVCRLWKDVIDGDHFREEFVHRLHVRCKSATGRCRRAYDIPNVDLRKVDDILRQAQLKVRVGENLPVTSAVAVYEIFAGEECMTLTLKFGMGQRPMWICKSKERMVFPIWRATVVLFVSVIIHEIFANKIKCQTFNWPLKRRARSRRALCLTIGYACFYIGGFYRILATR